MCEGGQCLDFDLWLPGDMSIHDLYFENASTPVKSGVYSVRISCMIMCCGGDTEGVFWGAEERKMQLRWAPQKGTLKMLAMYRGLGPSPLQRKCSIVGLIWCFLAASIGLNYQKTFLVKS